MADNNYSIHPRNWPDMRPEYREKQNTTAKKKRATVERAIAGVTRHLDQHPNCAMSRARLAKLKAQLPDAVRAPAELAQAAE